MGLRSSQGFKIRCVIRYRNRSQLSGLTYMYASGSFIAFLGNHARIWIVLSQARGHSRHTLFHSPFAQLFACRYGYARGLSVAFRKCWKSLRVTWADDELQLTLYSVQMRIPQVILLLLIIHLAIPANRRCSNPLYLAHYRISIMRVTCSNIFNAATRSVAFWKYPSRWRNTKIVITMLEYFVMFIGLIYMLFRFLQNPNPTAVWIDCLQ